MNLGQARQVVEAALDQRLQAAVGLSAGEFEVLWRLQSAPAHRLRMTEIAGLVLASKSGITRLIDRLVKAGLVERWTPADNRRAAYAKLTPRGRSVLSNARKAFDDAFQAAFTQHVSDADVLAARRFLRRLLAGNGAWFHERCEPSLAAQVRPDHRD